MAPLTTSQVKALQDKLGDDLAAFFVAEYGVEDDTPQDSEAE